MDKTGLQILHQSQSELQQPHQQLLSQYDSFLNFYRTLKHLNDNDTNLEDAFTTLSLNTQYDVVSCRITKFVKSSHMRVYKDTLGFKYYEVYMSDFTRSILDFITDFQILNSKGDVEYDFIHSASPEKHRLNRIDVINCFSIGTRNIPFGVRFTFKGEPYPIDYSFVGYIFNTNARKYFIENFGNTIFIRK